MSGFAKDDIWNMEFGANIPGGVNTTFVTPHPRKMPGLDTGEEEKRKEPQTPALLSPKTPDMTPRSPARRARTQAKRYPDTPSIPEERALVPIGEAQYEVELRKAYKEAGNAKSAQKLLEVMEKIKNIHTRRVHAFTSKGAKVGGPQTPGLGPAPYQPSQSFTTHERQQKLEQQRRDEAHIQELNLVQEMLRSGMIRHTEAGFQLDMSKNPTTAQQAAYRFAESLEAPDAPLRIKQYAEPVETETFLGDAAEKLEERAEQAERDESQETEFDDTGMSRAEQAKQTETYDDTGMSREEQAAEQFGTPDIHRGPTLQKSLFPSSPSLSMSGFRSPMATKAGEAQYDEEERQRHSREATEGGGEESRTAAQNMADFAGGGGQNMGADDPTHRPAGGQTQPESQPDQGGRAGDEPARDEPTEEDEARQHQREQHRREEEYGLGRRRGAHRRGRGGRRERGRERGREREDAPQFLRQMERVQQQPIVQRIVAPAQPAIVTIGGGGGGGVVRREVLDKGINIKVSQKQVMNEKTKRRSAKGDLKKARKVYNTLKRATVKAIRKGRADHYRKENENLKKLPAKQRKVARAKLRAKLKARVTSLIRKLPASTRMKLSDLQRVTSLARKLRW
jgi:hypothetical protein